MAVHAVPAAAVLPSVEQLSQAGTLLLSGGLLLLKRTGPSEKNNGPARESTIPRMNR
jgi:hypothetical protein